MQSNTTIDIISAVRAARHKHPVFPRSIGGKSLVLLEEVFELVWAACFQGNTRTHEELMDVAAVIVRWYEGD